jgi:hypothetical protein
VKLTDIFEGTVASPSAGDLIKAAKQERSQIVRDLKQAQRDGKKDAIEFLTKELQNVDKEIESLSAVTEAGPVRHDRPFAYVRGWNYVDAKLSNGQEVALTDNPYHERTDEHSQWVAGFNARKEKKA